MVNDWKTEVQLKLRRWGLSPEWMGSNKGTGMKDGSCYGHWDWVLGVGKEMQPLPHQVRSQVWWQTTVGSVKWGHRSWSHKDQDPSPVEESLPWLTPWKSNTDWPTDSRTRLLTWPRLGSSGIDRHGSTEAPDSLSFPFEEAACTDWWKTQGWALFSEVGLCKYNKWVSGWGRRETRSMKTRRWRKAEI